MPARKFAPSIVEDFRTLKKAIVGIDGAAEALTRIEAYVDRLADLEERLGEVRSLKAEVEELTDRAERAETGLDYAAEALKVLDRYEGAPHTGEACGPHFPINPWTCAACVLAKALEEAVYVER